MSRRWLPAVVALALIAGGWVVASRFWSHDPGSVAPPVSARELSQADHRVIDTLTPLGGGSQGRAHQLWDHYAQRDADHGVKPRLLGISRVRLTGTSRDGVYWLVFSDRVYTPSFGPDAHAGGLGREVVLVPDQGRSVTGNTMTF